VRGQARTYSAPSLFLVPGCVHPPWGGRGWRWACR
jgi:hypothetical protein